jgi:5-methylcytosine-specific restriction endonuclease McrA
MLCRDCPQPAVRGLTRCQHCREVVNAGSKRWSAANRDKCNVNGHNRRIRLAGNGGAFTYSEWLRLKSTVQTTLRLLREKESLEADHVLPIVDGGSGSIENIQPLCRTCNRRKGRKHIDFRPRHLTVRIPPSQGGYTGSIPVGATTV